MQSLTTASDLAKIDYFPLSFKNSISSEDFTEIYRPNDDSYQMLYSLIICYDQKILHQSLIGKEKSLLKIVEIGSGSGFVVGNFVNYLVSGKEGSELVSGLGVDLNMKACECASKFFKNHGLTKDIDLINADGLYGLDLTDFGIIFLFKFKILHSYYNIFKAPKF